MTNNVFLWQAASKVSKHNLLYARMIDRSVLNGLKKKQEKRKGIPGLNRKYREKQPMSEDLQRLLKTT